MCRRPVTLDKPRTAPTGSRLVISPNSDRSRNMASPVTTITTGSAILVMPTVQPEAESIIRPTMPALSR